MIVVTGAAGFIGSNIVHGLNDRGEGDVLAVDDLGDGRKFDNLSGCELLDYLDKDDFLAALDAAPAWLRQVRAVLHQGACTRTTEWDGRFMMRSNYEYSKQLLQASEEHGWQLIYASSAAVYGQGERFAEDPGEERPANVYAFSKWMFDQYVRRHLAAPGRPGQLAGLRYFNVYGPGEHHKGDMASIVWQLHQQLERSGELRLFEGSGGYGPGEQRRDFVHVDDVVAVNLWMLEHPGVSGIFNVGTGASRSFNAAAAAVIAWHGRGRIVYVPFPQGLAAAYQNFTEADLTRLRACGFAGGFVELEEGVARYLDRVGGRTTRG
jgi:ADP-L-glycero-D-manno-heptose 6-epimerase